MQVEYRRMLPMPNRRARGRHLEAGVVATLLAVLALGAFTGTAAARMGQVAADITTTAESTTSEPPAAPDTTTAATEPSAPEITSIVTTTVELTTTPTGLTPGGAAVVGAAAATTDDESDTQWGWIAFGILAAAVLVFGIVWLVRRSRHTGSAT